MYAIEQRTCGDQKSSTHPRAYLTLRASAPFFSSVLSTQHSVLLFPVPRSASFNSVLSTQHSVLSKNSAKIPANSRKHLNPRQIRTRPKLGQTRPDLAKPGQSLAKRGQSPAKPGQSWTTQSSALSTQHSALCARPAHITHIAHLTLLKNPTKPLNDSLNSLFFMHFFESIAPVMHACSSAFRRLRRETARNGGI